MGRRSPLFELHQIPLAGLLALGTFEGCFAMIILFHTGVRISHKQNLENAYAASGLRGSMERQRSIVSSLLGGIGVQLNEGGDRLGINLAIPTGKMQRKQTAILSLELYS